MAQNLQTNDFITRYLLGELREPELSRFEEEFFTHDDFYTLVLDKEDELIESYLRDSLSGRDCPPSRQDSAFRPEAAIRSPRETDPGVATNNEREPLPAPAPAPRRRHRTRSAETRRTHVGRRGRRARRSARPAGPRRSCCTAPPDHGPPGRRSSRHPLWGPTRPSPISSHWICRAGGRVVDSAASAASRMWRMPSSKSPARSDTPRGGSWVIRSAGSSPSTWRLAIPRQPSE